MNIRLTIFLIVNITSFQVIAIKVNCQSAVLNSTNIMKNQLNDQTHKLHKKLNDPKLFARGVVRCKQAIQSAKGVKAWTCQQTALNMSELQACQKQT